jgi:F0F1-type ATP synthase assembly protein I
MSALPWALIVGGLVGFGQIRQEVRATADAVRDKASREVVDAQYAAVIRELQAIRLDLAELKRRP